MLRKTGKLVSQDTQPLPAFNPHGLHSAEWGHGWERTAPVPSPKLVQAMKELTQPLPTAAIVVYRTTEPTVNVALAGAVIACLRESRHVPDELYVASITLACLQDETNGLVGHRAKDLFDGFFRFVLGKTVHEIPVFPEIRMPQWLAWRVNRLIPRDQVICLANL